MATTHVGGTPLIPSTTASSRHTALLPSPISNPKRSRSIRQLVLSLYSADRLRFSFGLAELLLGVTMWAKGQTGGSIGLTGLGYMVVFDAMGVMIALWAEVARMEGGSLSSIQRPFG